MALPWRIESRDTWDGRVELARISSTIVWRHLRPSSASSLTTAYQIEVIEPIFSIQLSSSWELPLVCIKDSPAWLSPISLAHSTHNHTLHPPSMSHSVLVLTKTGHPGITSHPAMLMVPYWDINKLIQLMNKHSTLLRKKLKKAIIASISFNDHALCWYPDIHLKTNTY